jgi:ATP-dependent Clp protease protease subunit
MDAETWLSAHKAIELGFADGILEDGKREKSAETFAFSRMTVTNSLLGKMPKPEEKPVGTSIESLDKRLSLILH